MDAYSSINFETKGNLVFVAQTCLYLAGKLEEHLDLQRSWEEFELQSRHLPAFAALMTTYGIGPGDFDWTEGPMVSLERHVITLLGFRLNFVSPSEISITLAVPFLD